MAVPWPSGLQQLVNEQSFTYSFGETVLKSDVDVGPKKYRRRFTRPIDTLSATVNLTVAQFSTFQTFYNTTINGGVTTFELNHPITGVLTIFRFAETPDVRPIGGTTFQLSMKWEVVGT